MKITDFDKYWKNLKIKSVEFRVFNKVGRLPDRKPRNEQDRLTLMKADKIRWQSRLKSGEIVITGPSQYTVKI